MLPMLVSYPVFQLACPLLQAFLQSFSHSAGQLELLQKPARVFQLLCIYYGLQSGQVAVARLLQRRNWQLWERLLMSQITARYLRQRHRLHQTWRLRHASLRLQKKPGDAVKTVKTGGGQHPPEWPWTSRSSQMLMLKQKTRLSPSIYSQVSIYSVHNIFSSPSVTLGRKKLPETTSYL